MKPQERRRIISITPIDVQPAPRIEVNDRRKRCVHCSNLATNDVLFKLEGATIMERYCDSCMVSLKIRPRPKGQQNIKIIRDLNARTETGYRPRPKK